MPLALSCPTRNEQPPGRVDFSDSQLVHVTK
jgi:hypothetical protein